MILTKFFINVFTRAIFIVLSGVLSGLIIHHLDRGYYYTLAGIIFLILLQAWFLVNLVNKTNADLERFFSSVQDHDSSVQFNEETGNDSFKKLYERMNYLNAVIRNIKIENERESLFLQNLVDHVDIGLLSYDSNGKIEIYNKAAERLLQVKQPRRLSSVKARNEELYRIINTISPGQEILSKVAVNNLLQSVLIKATEFKFEDNSIKLVSFQDLTNELDKKELDSWQKLIRVLTHEIMNSISPITSLASVISGYFKKKDDVNPIPPEKIDDQIIAKTLSGLDTIEETGKGLLGFVDKYRSLTALPRPEFCKFMINDLFRQSKTLMESGLPNNIKITSRVFPEDLALFADYSQVEQVLINLIRNGIAAVSSKKNGFIHLNAFYDEEGTIVQVEDNGMGITDDKIEDIFVPFYTTRENGSGIGLSISKQIMQNHNGTISVNSAPNKGATFTLRF